MTGGHERPAVEDLLERLTRADRRAAVWCACECARTVAHLLPEDERPRLALATAEAWVRGQATQSACEEAANAARGALRGGHGRAATTAAHAAWGCVRTVTRGSAAYVARLAVDAAWVVSVFDAPRDELDPAAVDVIRAYADAARVRNREALFERVSSLRWPISAPEPEQLHAAPEAVQVAWDLVVPDAGVDHTIAELVEAHARAERLGLDWGDPAQRAVAEHTRDEERVRMLLAPAAGAVVRGERRETTRR